MKNLLLKIALVLFVQNSFGQFKPFYKAHGFTLSHGATITSIAKAGGGVVLRGVAKPKYQDSLPLFINLTFADTKGLSTIYMQPQGSSIFYSDSSWLMRDAAMLVKSEKENEIYRDVSLFGNFTSSDYKKGYDEWSFYKVEMADSLRGTKSGQTLLYMDIILADDANTEYYSSNDKAYEKYEDSKMSLQNIINNYNDSIRNSRYKSINDIYFKLRNFDWLRQAGKLDHSEILLLNRIKLYSFYYLFKSELSYKFSSYQDTISNYDTEIDSLFNSVYSNDIDLKHGWSDYTYNDENTNYTFYYTENGKRLVISGEPNYTFLYKKIDYDYVNYEVNEREIDSLFTNYYMYHPDLIKNLNYIVVTNAQHFSKIAAFYRYLKKEYPKLWNQIYTHYSHMIKSKGATPGFIGRDPSDEY